MRLIDADKLRHALIMGHDLVGAKYTDMADTVKAIPIEFIEKQINKSMDINNKDELDILYAGNLSYLIKLWKEKI